ncbi:ATP-sensitive inward rectifier potassium channel 12-like [Branchiostoma floridae x Branchiostoma belcheri]
MPEFPGNKDRSYLTMDGAPTRNGRIPRSPPLHQHSQMSLISDSSTPGERTPIKKASMTSSEAVVRRRWPRFVSKDGICNYRNHHVPLHKRRYIRDFFTTLVDLRWRYTFLSFSAAFVLSWFLFGIVWYIVSLVHGDFAHEVGDPDFQPCVSEMRDFTSSFLFSLETQTTIGYGSRHARDNCGFGAFLVAFQSVVGLIIDTLMIGVFLTKLARPKKRAHTLLFSEQACIANRDGKLSLMFRVADIRKSHIVEAHVRVFVVRHHRKTIEGEELYLNFEDVNVGFDKGTDRVFLITPVTIVHEIDKESPFYDVSEDSLAKEDFEVVVLFEGILESSSYTLQARTSYLADEVLWGYHFDNMVSCSEYGYEVDYKKFNKTHPVPTHEYSARIIDAHRSSLSLDRDVDNNRQCKTNIDRTVDEDDDRGMDPKRLSMALAYENEVHTMVCSNDEWGQGDHVTAKNGQKVTCTKL